MIAATTSICFIVLPLQLSSSSHFPLPLSDMELLSHHDFVTRYGLEYMLLSPAILHHFNRFRERILLSQTMVGQLGNETNDDMDAYINLKEFEVVTLSEVL
jgi:hypothetical protein